MRKLLLWRLQPVDRLDPNWEASSYRGMVIVRARDEAAAREAAAHAFDVKTRFNPGFGIKAPPWERPNLVIATIIEDPRYSLEGPTEVLYPPRPHLTQEQQKGV